jgi:serine/threonine protein kinase
MAIVPLLLLVGTVMVFVLVLGVTCRLGGPGRRSDGRAGCKHRGPDRHPSWGAKHGARRAHRREPTIRIGRLILAILLFPVVCIIWAVASIGNLIEAAVHLAIGVIAALLGLLEAFFGRTSSHHWRNVGKEFIAFARHLYLAGRRFVDYVGFGGFLNRIEDGIREASRADGSLAPTPPLADASARDEFPFEDRYRIESHLRGGGSTARLFIVRRLERDRPVGGKLVLKYFDMGLGSRLEEVLRESRGMQVAREMGIVLDHDLGPDYFYYLMPYYEGETLTKAAARLHRRLLSGQGLEAEDLGTVLDWMEQTLRILDAYHRRGVIHKDVKPDNLIVTAEGVRLVDLGLMTPVESAMTLTTHGTEYFRDPEMVKLAVQGKRVRDVDAVRFDIYSAGAVLYLLLEGSFPACGPLSRFSRPVPMALSTITSRAMAEGAKRYPDVASMRADLEAVRSRMVDEDPARIPVSVLPSLRGFEAGEEPDEARPAPPPPPPPPPPLTRAAPVTPPPLAEEAPERKRRAGRGFVLTVSLIVCCVLGYFMLVKDQDPGLAVDAVERHVHAALPEVDGERVARFVEQRVDRDPEDRPPVVIASAKEPDGRVTDLVAEIRRCLTEREIPIHPSARLAEELRLFMTSSGWRDAKAVEERLELEEENPEPALLWIRPEADRVLIRMDHDGESWTLLGRLPRAEPRTRGSRARGPGRVPASPTGPAAERREE